MASVRAAISAAFEGKEIPDGISFDDLIDSTIEASTIMEDMDITSEEG